MGLRGKETRLKTWDSSSLGKDSVGESRICIASDFYSQKPNLVKIVEWQGENGRPVGHCSGTEINSSGNRCEAFADSLEITKKLATESLKSRLIPANRHTNCFCLGFFATFIHDSGEGRKNISKKSTWNSNSRNESSSKRMEHLYTTLPSPRLLNIAFFYLNLIFKTP